MPDAAETWKTVLPVVRSRVTGVGIWAALNAATPLIVEGDSFVLGLAPKDNDLAGHLRMPQTKRMIELELSRALNTQVTVRVIEGTTMADWERTQRRDAEARRLQEIAESKFRAELTAKTNWDGLYEQLSRRFAAVANKSLPQNRARFLIDAVGLLVEAYKEQPPEDDVNRRNFGRCIERISQYSEIPSTMVATMVLERVGSLETA